MDYVTTNGDGEGVVIVENAQTEAILGLHANSHCEKLIIDTGPGIEPASLAWKARGYSRRWVIVFNVFNSKPNVKLWFHSAPLWKMDKFQIGQMWTKLQKKKKKRNFGS